ncbi:hypothetical protein NDU88_001741 [Pleurodeles waltl]|uniref:Uncharacterized protein n=1 Tax=Pleurodeles waltl TaxID=8319 RepID=A0AAV7MPB3_PLEWA|nr:hypothetical protein NDU88_001741 [Pleurodeles waltl]
MTRTEQSRFLWMRRGKRKTPKQEAPAARGEESRQRLQQRRHQKSDRQEGCHSDLLSQPGAYLSLGKPANFLKSAPVGKEVPDGHPWREGAPGMPVALTEWQQRGTEQDSGHFKGVCPEKEAVWLKEETDPEEVALAAKDGTETAFAGEKRKSQERH